MNKPKNIKKIDAKNKIAFTLMSVFGLMLVSNSVAQFSLTNKYKSEFIIKNVNTKVASQPIEDISQIFNKLDSTNINKTEINYTDATKNLFFNYDDDASIKIKEALDNAQNSNVSLLPNVTLSNKLNIEEFGYKFPLIDAYQEGQFSNEILGNIVNQWLIQNSKMKDNSGYYIDFYNEKKWWPEQIYASSLNATPKENDGYFHFGEHEPFIIYDKLPNIDNSSNQEEPKREILSFAPIYDALFKLYSKDTSNELDNKRWIWADKNIFDISAELYKLKDELNPDWCNDETNYIYPNSNFYLWFVQTGTKVVYEQKSTHDTPTLPSFSNDNSSPLPKNWFSDWENSWDKKYVVSDDSKISFLGITQDSNHNKLNNISNGYGWATHINPKIMKSDDNRNIIEYVPYYSKEPESNVKNYVEDKPISSEGYDFRQGIAFYINIPNWAPFTFEDGHVITLSELFNYFKRLPAENFLNFQQYSKLESKVENLRFFTDQKPIKQNIFKIFSNVKEVPYINNNYALENYALKDQILYFAQCPENLDIKNFIVPVTKYNKLNNSYELSFQFNENFVNMILNLYNLTAKAWELRNNTTNTIYREANYVATDYISAYANKPSNKKFWTADWYLKAQEDFNLDLKNAQAIGLEETLSSNITNKTLSLKSTPWIFLLNWIKNTLSKDIYVDYQIGSNSKTMTTKIWDGTNYEFINSNKISSPVSEDNKQIKVTNLRFGNDSLSSNLISKLKIDNQMIKNGSCTLSNNNDSLIYTFGEKSNVDDIPIIDNPGNETDPNPILPPNNNESIGDSNTNDNDLEQNQPSDQPENDENVPPSDIGSGGNSNQGNDNNNNIDQNKPITSPESGGNIGDSNSNNNDLEQNKPSDIPENNESVPPSNVESGNNSNPNQGNENNNNSIDSNKPIIAPGNGGNINVEGNSNPNSNGNQNPVNSGNNKNNNEKEIDILGICIGSGVGIILVIACISTYFLIKRKRNSK